MVTKFKQTTISSIAKYKSCDFKQNVSVVNIVFAKVK